MENRPDPEELLARYHLRDSDEQEMVAPDGKQSNHQQRRGRLRVYLGAAAGVGKTYAMLNEGQRRKERGTDVVIGYIETHQRPQTVAQLCDLEMISRPKVPDRR